MALPQEDPAGTTYVVTRHAEAVSEGALASLTDVTAWLEHYLSDHPGEEDILWVEALIPGLINARRRPAHDFLN